MLWSRLFRAAIGAVFLLCSAGVLYGQPTGRIGRSQAAFRTAFTDLAQTWSGIQIYDAPLQLGTTSNPTQARQVGYNGTDLGYHDGVAFHPFAFKSLINGAGLTQAHKLNLVAGTNVTLSQTESPSGQVNVTVNVSGTSFDVLGNPIVNSASGQDGKVRVLDAEGSSIQSNQGLEYMTFSGSKVGYSRHLLGVTTNATPTEIFLGGNSSDKLTISAGQTRVYILSVAARGTSGTNANKSAFYIYKVAISKTGGTTSLLNASAPEVIINEVPGWDTTFAVSDSPSHLVVNAVGDSGTTVSWRIFVQEIVAE